MVAISEPDKGFARRAFVSLFLILAAHAMTETARDALFLSRLPATKLPWMYLLVAVATVLVSRALLFLAPYVRKSLLPVMLLGSGITRIGSFLVPVRSFLLIARHASSGKVCGAKLQLLCNRAVLRLGLDVRDVRRACECALWQADDTVNCNKEQSGYKRCAPTVGDSQRFRLVGRTSATGSTRSRFR